MNTRRFSILLALAPFALACGANTVDLDATVLKVSNEPGVLGIVYERVETIEVDDERLYWAGSHLPNSENKNVWFLHSCKKHACPTTLVTYDAQLYGVENVFSVHEGEIYWYRANTNELLSCPVAGCSGPPRTLATELHFSASTFDGGQFYFADGNTINRLPLTEPDQRQLVAPTEAALQAITIRDDYAYWLADSLLLRARTDGSSAVETISTDVKYSFNHYFSVTTDASSIYWTNNLLAGSINRCLLTGCTGTPDLVLGPLRAPQKLQVDGSQLHYQYEPRPYEYALASCTLPACAAPELLAEHLDAPGVLAMDDQYLYLATTDQDVSPLNAYENTIARIRRLPKPHREVP